MEQTITITFTPEGNLELPPEIREQFVNGEKYAVSMTDYILITVNGFLMSSFSTIIKCQPTPSINK
ncbi:hypothetical protein [Anabaena azotica]|uniref:hypothetical protein n=1 Tax=Anabaena azotica TaxID=197653 RepID=UPI0039A50103